MLQRTAVRLTTKLLKSPHRTFRNYPYFQNSYSSPLNMPEYFIMYDDIHRKSNQVFAEDFWDDFMDDDDYGFEYLSEEQKGEYMGLLQNLQAEARAVAIETKPNNRKKAKAKKKRNRRRFGREISANLK